MITIGHGMAHEYGDGNLYPPIRFKIFPELDKREKELVLRISILGKSSETEPRKGGNRAIVGGLSGSCLDDASYIPVLRHIGHHRLVERLEIRAIFTPDIGKGLILRME